MNNNLLKILNTSFDLFIWVGLWNIYENILSRFSFTKNTLLLIYFLTIVGSFSLIFLLNKKLSFTQSLYG